MAGLRLGYFAALDDGDQHALLDAAHPLKRWPRGQWLFSSGDEGDRLYIVQRGAVGIDVQTPRLANAMFTVLGADAVVGEIATFTHGLRTATATALVETETISISRGALDRLRQKRPAIDQAVIELLGETVARLSSQLIEERYLDQAVKLRRQLLHLHYRVFDKDRIVLSQEQLGQLIGASRPTVNELLRAEVAAGRIEQRQRSIRVLDTAELRREALL